MCQARSGGGTRGSKDGAWSQDTPRYGQIPKAVSRALERPVALGVWVRQERSAQCSPRIQNLSGVCSEPHTGLKP